MTREDVYTGALGAIYEMIDCGVTAFADHYFFPDQICEAVIKTGIKGDIAPTIFGMAEGYEEQLKDSIDLILRMNGINPRLNIRMGPHSPYTCPGGTLKTIIQMAKDMGVGIHIHVSETLGQVRLHTVYY
jgi:5-methylthioadenosine/S-adenosylhomocysteine deaminase